MLQAFVITLREGLEAFLIVAISLAYLKKTGRRELLPAVHWGIVASVILSIGAGLLLARARNQSLWEGDPRHRRRRARGLADGPHVACRPAHEDATSKAGWRPRPVKTGTRRIRRRVRVHAADDHA